VRQARPDAERKLLRLGMAKFRTAMSVIFFGVCTAAAAQTPGLGDTRTLPPEKKAPPATESSRTPPESGHELKRCDDYSGTMREDCLRELRAAEGAAAAGASRRPVPPTAPPPQNPR
jgi:hypothetical protein